MFILKKKKVKKGEYRRCFVGERSGPREKRCRRNRAQPPVKHDVGFGNVDFIREGPVTYARRQAP